MSAVLLVLKIVGILILAALLIVCVVLLLPAGIRVSWQNAKAEIWLSIGPLRRRFYPPRTAKQEPEEEKPKQEKTQRSQTTEPAETETPAQKDAEQPATAQTGAGEPENAHKEPPPDEVDRLYENMMGNPMKYIRLLSHWAKGPGKLLLAHLKVRRVKIVWTVTADDAAATAIAYGALAAACNTAWAILEDLVDVRADELRLEPDFTGERAGERCFSCQITARMYIIVASVILTVWRRAVRRSASGKKKTAKTADAK